MSKRHCPSSIASWRPSKATTKKQRDVTTATERHDLNEADKWRQCILREIGRNVMEIQNAGLGEHRIRDLNDEINKLIREKRHWERRILQLGGPDYAKTGPKVTEGRPVASSGGAGRGPGYKYFGAARNLPGVEGKTTSIDESQVLSAMAEAASSGPSIIHSQHNHPNSPHSRSHHHLGSSSSGGSSGLDDGAPLTPEQSSQLDLANRRRLSGFGKRIKTALTEFLR